MDRLPAGASAALPQLLGALEAVSGSSAAETPGVLALCSFVSEELGAELPSERPTPSPEQLSQALPIEGQLATTQRLALAAMLVPPLDAARLDRLEAYAAALGQAELPVLRDLRLALAGHHRRLTSGLMRRFPPMQRVRSAWRAGSAGARWRLVKAMARLPDRGTAARYAALAELPEGTLGRGYFEHCRQNGFVLPGERGGLPEAMTFHDMGHVLAGAPTDVAGETRMAGIEAGCMGAEGFTMLEFALLLFNLGAQLPTDASPAIGQIDMGLLLASFEEGQRSRFPVLEWQPWEEIERPLSELRARYGLSAG